MTDCGPNFDERAATWDADTAHRTRAAAIARCIIDAVPLHPATRMLEYGAGTGLLTEALRERVGPVTLADTSHGMREVVQAKIDAGSLRQARVWDVDLATQPPPEGEQFDLIATAMALHHVDDIDLVLTRFAELLAPGGHLCIADLDHEDGSFHGPGFAGHNGFERDALADALVAAGFAQVAIGDCYRMERDGRSYPVFLATATTPPSEPSRQF